MNQPDRSKHKDRIEAMIEEAHKYEEVSGAEELDKDEKLFILIRIIIRMYFEARIGFLASNLGRNWP